MNNVLCDTNVISELMRRDPNDRVVRFFHKLQDVYLSVITVEEIHYGLSRQKLEEKAGWFERFVDRHCRVLPVDAVIARQAGELRGRLAARGITRTQADLLIAATAWHHGLTVVTRNRRDFEDTAVAVLNPFE